jgi:hypothetical protein
MKRCVSAIKIGEGQIRYKTRLEDEYSEKGSDQAREQQYFFIRQILDNLVLLDCGMQRFQTLKVFHSGVQWIAEAVAVVDTYPT